MIRSRIQPLWLLVTTLALTGVQAHANDQQRFQRFFEDRLTVKAEPVNGKAYREVFKPGIYLVTTGFDFPGMGKHSFHAALVEDRVVRIGTDRGGDRKTNLEAMLRPDFVIQDHADAATFEKALNDIYLGRFGNTRDHHIVQKNGQWFFVRDESFDKYKGFAVTLDKDQRIKRIDFSSELPVTPTDFEQENTSGR